MGRTEAYIKPEMLRWARERVFPDLPSAAVALRQSADRLAAWETGARRPTLNQARELAHRLRVPFGYLYLSAPPEETLPIPDLRTLPETPDSNRPSPDFLEVLYDAQHKQAWYRDELLESGASPLPFVGRFSKAGPPQEIAEDLAATLGLDSGLRQRAGSSEAFLTSLVRRSEAAGVLTLRSGVVGNDGQRPLDLNEFRGFVLVDEFAPLIFLNGQDAVAARIFTLAHELAHIWISEPGVSDLAFMDDETRPAPETERLCNRIAANALLPPQEFIRQWRNLPDDSTKTEKLAREFRVSRPVVIYQAYDQGQISLGQRRQLIQEYRRNAQMPPSAGSGGNFHNNLSARCGRLLLNAVLQSFTEERIPLVKAANLLNIRGSAIYKLLEQTPDVA